MSLKTDAAPLGCKWILGILNKNDGLEWDYLE